LISGREFERDIADVFRRRGFTLTGFGGAGQDGCADLGLIKEGRRYLVQCRYWRKGHVGLAIVRQMHAVMLAQAVQSGFLVTLGEFSADAREFAALHGIELLDRTALQTMLVPQTDRIRVNYSQTA
jgi:restriction system protein